MTYSNDLLQRVLIRTNRIAIVGLSPKPDRASHQVARYLLEKGYQIIPINPGHSGSTILNAPVMASLADIDGPVDMIDIFRRSDAVPGIVDEALVKFPTLQTIWMQLGVQNGPAAAKAEKRGVDVIQNRCPKIEYRRLFGSAPLDLLRQTS